MGDWHLSTYCIQHTVSVTEAFVKTGIFSSGWPTKTLAHNLRMTK